MTEILAQREKLLPEYPTAYPGEREKLISKIQSVYGEPIYSLEREVERERKIAELYARKRYIESL